MTRALALSHLAPPVYGGLRLTIPAREALAAAGNRVDPGGADAYGRERWIVTLVRPPASLVLVLIGHGAEQHRGLRTDDEQAYPGEWTDGITWWERGGWIPCPDCGHALLWCEAGFVPGWRICLAGHAVQLAEDGRSAGRMPGHDRATLAATRRT